MNRISLLIFSVLFLFSCEKEEGCSNNVELEGTWQLIESLADPGDGSGTYQPVNEYYTITFRADRTFVLNESICDSPDGNTEPTTGTYSNRSLTYDINDCFRQGVDHSYEQCGSTLIIRPPCFEGCGQKYKKLD